MAVTCTRTTVHGVAEIEAGQLHYFGNSSTSRPFYTRQVRFLDCDGQVILAVTAYSDRPNPEAVEISASTD